MAPMNPARLWSLATASLLTELNEQDHSLLGGGAPGPQAAADRLEVLKRDWGAGTREELLKAMNDLAHGGHRKLFNDSCALDVATVATCDPWEDVDKKISDKDTLHNIYFTRAHRERIGSKSLLAWDAGRLVTIAGWGVLAGMISEDEAWSYILPMAQTVQKTYTSWEDYGVGYMLGHEMWSGAWDASLARAYLAMLDGAQAPWKRQPWGTDLNQHGLAIPLQAVDALPAPPPQPLVKKKFNPVGPLAGDGATPEKGGRSMMGIVISAVTVLILAGVGISFAMGLIGPGAAKPPPPAPPPSAPAAVEPTAPPAPAAPTHSGHAAPAASHSGGAPPHHAPAPGHSASAGGKTH